MTANDVDIHLTSQEYCRDSLGELVGGIASKRSLFYGQLFEIGRLAFTVLMNYEVHLHRSSDQNTDRPRPPPAR